MTPNQLAANVVNELGPDYTPGERLSAARRLSADLAGRLSRRSPQACADCRRQNSGDCRLRLHADYPAATDLARPDRFDGD
jgi:hypothetical protein